MRERRRPPLVWIILTVVAVVAVVGVGGTARAVVHRTTAGTPSPVPAAAAADPSADPSAQATPTPTSAAAGTAADSAAAVKAAVKAVDAFDTATGGSDFGVAVLDRTTGQEADGARGAAQFYSASVVKLYTVVAIMHRVEAGEVTLTATDTDDIRRALSLSDDNAMDALWEKFGGPATVSQTIDLVGLTDSAPPTDGSQWGETLISARDVVAVYDYVLQFMAPSSRDMIMDALADAQDSGADGFDQAFGLIAPPRRADVAAKQGWMWIGKDFYLHTTGVFGTDDRYVVAVLSRNPASSGSAAARKLVTTAASDAVTALTNPS